MNDLNRIAVMDNSCDDPAARAEDLCSLFSKTVSSLAADAAALRQLKYLSIAVNDEQENQSPNDDDTIAANLRAVDFIVTELEKKVRTLQEIATEEKQSLNEMEAVKDAAAAQNEILKTMLREHENAILLQRRQQQPIRNVTLQPTPPTYSGESQTTHHDGVLRSGAKHIVGPHRRDSVDPRQKHTSASSTSTPFQRVSQSEWDSVSRTIRGHISLAGVNDALLDIERVFHRKYALINSRQTTKRGHPTELQVDAHGETPWVSEQDLRQYCAFFRNGESTARAILLILRTVRRLKQVPGKHSQVTYSIWPTQDE